VAVYLISYFCGSIRLSILQTSEKRSNDAEFRKDLLRTRQGKANYGRLESVSNDTNKDCFSRLGSCSPESSIRVRQTRIMPHPHNEMLSVSAMRISNEDCSPVAIHSRDAAPTPTGFAEIVSDSRLRLPLAPSRFHAPRSLFERDVLNVSRNPPDVAKRVFTPP
jgi:hypothetical protein